MSFINFLEGALPLTIYTVLKGEHMEIRGLLAALEASPEGVNAGKDSLYEQLRRELLSHARAEETVVYSRARRRISPEEVDHAEREHMEIEHVLESLRSVDPHTHEWKFRLGALAARLEHHIHEEERVMLERMKDVFGDDEARDMARSFHDMKLLEMKALQHETVTA